MDALQRLADSVARRLVAEELASGGSVCSIDGCDAPVHGRGWCGKHYQRWHTHGDPQATWGHGHTSRAGGSPTYRSWNSMLGRCNNPRNPSWARYGGRGIVVCERWRTFENFLADMGERPEGTSIDRIDGEGNYEPGNCRWATPHEQRVNQKRKGRTHGTPWTYRSGCRCEPCREAQRTYAREYSRQRRAKAKLAAAEHLDLDAAGAAPRSDPHGSDRQADSRPSLLQRQQVPVAAEVDGHDQARAA